MSSKLAVIIGAHGALGGALLRAFAGAGWRTVGVDVAHCSGASVAVKISGKDGAADSAAVLAATSGAKADAVVCVAGGFAMAGAAASELFAQAEQMWAFNVASALLACHVAARAVAPGGLLALTGAAAALRPQPAMLAYGASKAATHYLLKSVAADESFEATAGVIGLLPVMIDTPGNRAAMPDADRGTWTPPEHIAAKVLAWATASEARPARGALVRIATSNAQSDTTFEEVKDAQ